MCGLVGVAGKVTPAVQTALAFLGTLSSLRGDNSTGIMDFVPGYNPPCEMFKTLEQPEAYFAPQGAYYQRRYYKRYKKHEPSAIAVHTRLATVGKVSRDNAHPFLHKSIIGMHNGTMRAKFNKRDDFETDSEALVWNIAEHGDDFIKELSRIDGAYALVWFNLKEKTLNFYRNNERPLFVMRTYDKDQVFWASDDAWLKGVLPYFDFRGYAEQVPTYTKITIPVKDQNGPKNWEEERIERPFVQRSFDRIGTGTSSGTKDLSFGIGTATYSSERPTARWNYEANMFFTPEEEQQWKMERNKREREAARLIQEAKEREAKAKETKAVSNVVQMKTDSQVALEQAQKRNTDDVIVGKNGKLFFQTLPDVFCTEDFYRRILAHGCRGCDSKILLYDDVKFLTPRDFLCEACKHDHMIVNLVKEEIRQDIDKGTVHPVQPAGKEDEYDARTNNLRREDETELLNDDPWDLDQEAEDEPDYNMNGVSVH